MAGRGPFKKNKKENALCAAPQVTAQKETLLSRAHQKLKYPSDLWYFVIAVFPRVPSLGKDKWPCQLAVELR